MCAHVPSASVPAPPNVAVTLSSSIVIAPVDVCPIPTTTLLAAAVRAITSSKPPAPLEIDNGRTHSDTAMSSRSAVDAVAISHGPLLVAGNSLVTAAAYSPTSGERSDSTGYTESSVPPVALSSTKAARFGIALANVLRYSGATELKPTIVSGQ